MLFNRIGEAPQEGGKGSEFQEHKPEDKWQVHVPAKQEYQEASSAIGVQKQIPIFEDNPQLPDEASSTLAFGETGSFELKGNKTLVGNHCTINGRKKLQLGEDKKRIKYLANLNQSKSPGLQWCVEITLGDKVERHSQENGQIRGNLAWRK